MKSIAELSTAELEEALTLKQRLNKILDISFNAARSATGPMRRGWSKEAREKQSARMKRHWASVNTQS